MIYPTYPDPFLCVSVLDDEKFFEALVETLGLLTTVVRHYDESFVGVETKEMDHSVYRDYLISSRGRYDWMCVYLASLFVRYKFEYDTIHSYAHLFDSFVEKGTLFPVKANFVNFPNITDFKFAQVHIAYRRHLLNEWSHSNPMWYGKRYSFVYWDDLESQLLPISSELLKDVRLYLKDTPLVSMLLDEKEEEEND